MPSFETALTKFLGALCLRDPAPVLTFSNRRPGPYRLRRHGWREWRSVSLSGSLLDAISNISLNHP